MKRLSVLIAVTALALAGCGGSDDGGSTSGGGGNTAASSGGGAYGGASNRNASKGNGETLALAADPNGAFTFDKSQLTARAGTVTIDFDNPSSATAQHAVEVEGGGVEEETDTVDPGSKASVTIKDLKPGTYEFYCPVDGHKEAGMKGTLTVR